MSTTTVARRSYRSVIRLKRSSPPARAKGPNPSSSMMTTSTRSSRRCWQACELAGVPRFEELADQIGGARKEHTPFLFGRFDAKRDRWFGR